MRCAERAFFLLLLLLGPAACRRAFLLEDVYGERAINWAPTHVSHNHAAGCVHPPPVGNQCMLREADAVPACISMD